jgi:hypothetical protein
MPVVSMSISTIGNKDIMVQDYFDAIVKVNMQQNVCRYLHKARLSIAARG